MTRVQAGCLYLFVCLAACATPERSQSRPLDHEAYVWQHAWTSVVSTSVAKAPPGLAALRVLIVEVSGDGTMAWPNVKTDTLRRTGREVSAVVRIDGSRPMEGFSFGPVLETVETWRKAGVNVIGLEIDHDCATAALDDYASWLRPLQTPGLRLSITALPTWMGSPALLPLAKVVDEMVLQVHAIAAPEIFNATQARRWIHQFARAIRSREFRVALPTYRVQIAGTVERADPREVASLLAALKLSAPKSLRGFVWFRLPILGDTAAWSTATLEALIAQRPLRAEVAARLMPSGPGLFDVLLANQGTLDSSWPNLRLEGETAVDLLGGFAKEPGYWRAPRRVLAAGEHVVIGWVRGDEVSIDVL